MKEVVLRTQNLTKEFRGRRVVDRLNLEVHRGDIFGFLGPNGAGKTTTLRMLAGLLHPTEGDAEIFGLSLRRHGPLCRRKVGVLVEVPSFYEYLSGRQNLLWLARLSGGKVKEEEVEEALAWVGLAERADDKVRVYSHGMKQRLGLAQALVPWPELLLLDEPTSGLDPKGMREIRELLVRLARQRGVTIFLSSHLLHEVEQICNRVAIVDRGRLRAMGEVEVLLRGEKEEVEVEAFPQEEAEAVLKELPFVEEVRRNGSRWVVRLAGPHRGEMNRALVRAGLEVVHLASHRPALEDYFLASLRGEGEEQV